MKKLDCILLIDDDPIAIFLNKRMIEKLGITEEILIAKNGEEGLVKIQEYCRNNNRNSPEIIFLDINMPVMDGFDFVKEFKNLRNINEKDKTRISMLTSSADHSDLVKTFDLGVKSFMVKPLTEKILLTILNK